MRTNTGERTIHGYGTAARRVLCGISEQASSTKHFHFVTCATCRERMEGLPAGTPDRPAGPSGG
jgi:hypothetical protein